jgi:hypothetical protein
MTDWLAWIGAVGGTIGAVAGVAAVIVARSARSAAADTAAAAVRAAKVADEAVAESVRVSRLEFEKRHDELSPRKGLRVYFGTDQSTVGGTRWLWIVIEVPRTYHVRGVARGDGGSWDLGLPLVLHANRRTAKVEVEKLPADRDRSVARELVLRFWPPADGDQGEHWTCRCGRPVDADAADETGHWEVAVPVDYADTPPKSRFR